MIQDLRDKAIRQREKMTQDLCNKAFSWQKKHTTSLHPRFFVLIRATKPSDCPGWTG